MIEVESEALIRASREALWRHLTRVPDWYRWYPGMHGVDTENTITSTGHAWRATGQMGRLLYRSELQVSRYELMRLLEVTGTRRPWFSHIVVRFRADPDGPNTRLRVEVEAEPSFGLAGRLLVSGSLKRRLQREADEICSRFRSYLEETMPHH